MEEVALPFCPPGVNRRAGGTSIASHIWLGIAGPSLRQGAAGAAHFEPGGVSFWDFPWWPAGYIDSEIFNKFVPVSFGRQEVCHAYP